MVGWGWERGLERKVPQCLRPDTHFCRDTLSVAKGLNEEGIRVGGLLKGTSSPCLHSQKCSLHFKEKTHAVVGSGSSLPFEASPPTDVSTPAPILIATHYREADELLPALGASSTLCSDITHSSRDPQNLPL